MPCYALRRLAPDPRRPEMGVEPLHDPADGNVHGVMPAGVGAREPEGDGFAGDRVLRPGSRRGDEVLGDFRLDIGGILAGYWRAVIR